MKLEKEEQIKPKQAEGNNENKSIKSVKLKLEKQKKNQWSQKLVLLKDQ